MPLDYPTTNSRWDQLSIGFYCLEATSKVSFLDRFSTLSKNKVYFLNLFYKDEEGKERIGYTGHSLEIGYLRLNFYKVLHSNGASLSRSWIGIACVRRRQTTDHLLPYCEISWDYSKIAAKFSNPTMFQKNLDACAY